MKDIYNINDNMGYNEIIYAPSYFASSDGILQVEEEETFNLDSYLVFNHREYTTIEDFKLDIINLLEKNANIHYNILSKSGDKYDIITISHNNDYIRIYILKPKNKSINIQEQIVQKFLYRDVFYNNRMFKTKAPFRSLTELNTDIRNVFNK